MESFASIFKAGLALGFYAGAALVCLRVMAASLGLNFNGVGSADGKG
jgi:hypothetical protein